MPDSQRRLPESGLDLSATLDVHDTLLLVAAVGRLVLTGAMQTNVNDFRPVLILGGNGERSSGRPWLWNGVWLRGRSSLTHMLQRAAKHLCGSHVCHRGERCLTFIVPKRRTLDALCPKVRLEIDLRAPCSWRSSFA